MTFTASTLTERAFTEQNEPEWQILHALTRRARGGGVRALSPEDVARLPELYRGVCADLAAAEAARYTAALVDYLRDLVAQSHALLYAREAPRAGVGFRRAWLVAFPRALRQRTAPMLLAAALFFLPLALGLALTLREPTFAFRIVPEAMLRPLARAYAQGFGEGRDAGASTLMAGFYVYNNVGIALRCFATGIFGGLGSAFYLVQNGLSIGAILGYVTSQGAGENILTFILGHGSLELGAIVISGGAGLSLGWAVVAPGDATRIASVQRAARELLVIVAGAAIMLLMAAALEGFWSASSASKDVKLIFGSVVLVLVLGYVALAGRGEDGGP